MSTQRTITEEELLANLGWVHSLARRLVGEQGEDLTQQVCLVALDRGRIAVPGTAEGTGRRVRAWLTQATVFLAGKHWRGERRRRDRERLAAQGEAQPSTLDLVERNALLGELVQALGGLEEPYRSTVLLRYLDQLPTAAIASRMGVSEVAVRKRMSRGFARLRERLRERRIEPGSLGAIVALAPAGETSSFFISTSAGASAAASTTLGATMATTLTKVTLAAAIAGGATLVVTQDMQALDRPVGETTALVADIEQEPRPDLDPVVVPDSPGSVLPAPLEEEADHERSAALPDRRAASRKQEETQRLAARELQLQMEMLDVMSDLESLMAAGAGAAPLPDGYHVDSYEDGTRKAAGMIVDGHRSGEWTFWHPDGALEARGSYFAGKEQGPWVHWDSEGLVTSSGEQLYGRREGPWITTEGGLRSEQEHRDGDLHGARRQTRADGTLAVEDAWFLGKQHGLARTYHPGGQLASQGHWEHGQQLGAWKYWNEAGVLDQERSGYVETKEPGDALSLQTQGVLDALEGLGYVSGQ